MSDSKSVDNVDEQPKWLGEDRMLALTLIGATLLAFYLCYLLVEPFLPALAWALALAVVAAPMHRWISDRIKQPSLAAGISVLLVGLLVGIPAILVGQQLISEGVAGVQLLQSEMKTQRLRSVIESSPQLAPLLEWAETQFDIPALIQRATGALGGIVSSLVSGSVWTVVIMMITFFVLFFFFRDRRKALGALRSIVPLSHNECEELFIRVDDTIHATVYGTLTVSLVQGVLGGLMFWWLGLPGPVLWGAVMGLLGIVPVLGAFVIWVPAAIILLMQGDVTSAIILTIWGTIVVGLVDNVLYPILVGKRLRIHTLPVFFSILGGLAAFGAAGLIIGPVVLSITDALLHIWHKRLAHGGTAEEMA
jgi:predicted PurR-regulated permease PerM